MTALLLAARLLLAAVFAVAGAAKLADLPGSRAAVAAFGVPRSLAGVAGTLLPLVELVVAVLLLPEATAWWAAVAGLLLLAAFCAAITISLSRGERPNCHCFGALHSEPVGARTLARNAALAAVALFVVAAGSGDAGPGAVEWVADLAAAEAIALAAVAVALVAVAGAAALALHLLRAHGRLLLRIDDLEARLAGAGIELAPPTGDSRLPAVGPAPDFALPALDGTTITLADLLAPARPLLLVFSHPDCGPCRELAPAVAEWEQSFAGEVELAVISGGTAEAARREFGALRADRVLLESELDVAVSVEYDVSGTPAAVLVAADGTVAAGPAGGAAGVEGLAGHALAFARHAEPEPAGLEPGSPAPDLVLASVDGETVALRTSRPTGALVLFWNPDCGFCQALLPRLLAWERAAPEHSPELLVVSSADAGRLAGEGFRGPLLLDRDGTAMEAFGASGTPMAVRLDADARVASRLAAGADEVMELAEGAQAAHLEVHRRGPAASATPS